MKASRILDDLLTVHEDLSQKIKKGKTLDRYVWIQQNVNADSVLTREFQKKFNGFYGVMRLPSQAYVVFYQIFSNYLKSTWDYNDLLKQMTKVRNNIEMSFASKIQHTKDTSLPIVDSNLLEYLGWDAPRRRTSIRSTQHDLTVELLRRLTALYRLVLKDERWLGISEAFDRIVKYEGFRFSEEKKLDTLLWQRKYA